jgi:arylsulfatase A
MLSRRDLLKAAAACAFPISAQNRPNIVLILADDLGYECLGCNGGESYRTPHLDRLAATGIRFTQAYAQPLCTPTRLQMMTGLYNFRNWQAFGIMDPKTVTFGHIMQKAGYKTCIAGKWQFWSYNPPGFEPEWRGKGQRVEDAGFDDYCVWHAGHTEEKGSRYADPVIYHNGKAEKKAGEYGDDIFAKHVSDFMNRHRNEPFFVYYPMALTHGPFNPTPRSKDWAKGPRLKNDTKYFGDMVKYMDEVVGRVAAKVDDLGLARNTLILFYGDNGSPREVQSRFKGRMMQGGKGSMTDAGTHVALIARWKGRTPEGKVIDDLVDSTDFLPTIGELTGARVPKNDGHSFAPQLRGERGQPRDWVFFHHDPRPGHDKERFRLERAARDKRYRLYDDGRMFDAEADPLEQNPLPGTAAPEARRKLQRVLGAMRS